MNIFRNRLKSIGIAIIAICFSQSIFGATATGTLGVAATILTECIIAATPLAFGNYDPTSSTDLDTTATISVTCTLAAAYNIGLDAGGGSGASVTTRKMTRALNTDTLNYGIYQNAGRSTVWGNTIGTNTVASTGLGILQTFTAYGRAPALQPQPAGGYADTVNITVTY